ncbi:GRB2-associated-binding protein 1-like isoform X2 [Gigantopelta aegis]|uniref:GRB2-associated-binding protein 1-like isoform X2 n=1 Tax=Gigantopelta aegis TaxID=1735272 RepID=UPI001B88A2B8|nr:GRB2-associated-binding protein 1-like isoform X2 [Gigantopelta aegis]
MGLTKMNKIEHKVHSGWLVKSPPERKTTFRIFKSKWKRRFFVLFKPSGSLPGQYELNYYNDDLCTKKKGTIDLEQCEQIIESLDSEQFPYLLAIKTICRGKDRTYFLSADSEEEMTAWVRNLCSVCELKQEDTPTDIPEPKKNAPASDTVVTGSQNDTPNGNVQSSALSHHITTTQPMSINKSQSISKRVLQSPTTQKTPPSSPSYIPVWESNSGSQKKKSSPCIERSNSIDSVPEEMAPPPPMKVGLPHGKHDHNSGHDSVFTYDFPPSKRTAIPQDLYQVPPTRTLDSTDSRQSSYDVPPHLDPLDRPTHAPSVTTAQAYDTPPRSGRSLHNVTKQQAYDTPPSVQQPYDIAPHVPQPCDTPPHVQQQAYDTPPHVQQPHCQKSANTPPQAHKTVSSQEAYDTPPLCVPRSSPNVCKSSAVERKGIVTLHGQQTSPPNLHAQLMYDVVPTHNADQNLVLPPQRPPRPHVQSAYQNIPHGSKLFDNTDLSAVPAAPKALEKPLQLDSYDIPKSNTDVAKSVDLSSVAPAPKPCTPANIHPYINAASGVMDIRQPGYIAMDGELEEVYTDMSVLRLPPGSEFGPPLETSYTDMKHQNGAPPLSCRAPRPVTSSSLRAITAANPDADMYLNQIWSSQRTKSFKRHDDKHSVKVTSLRRPIPVTVDKSPLQLPSHHDTVSSSDEEDDDGTNGVHIPKQMRAVPPPPGGEDKELKYLDLALDEYTQEPTAKLPITGHISHSTPTEYREIDFVKTQALSNTKKWKDGQMKMEKS